MFKIEPGRKKGDDTLISNEEAEKFNKELPNFFSEEYEN